MPTDGERLLVHGHAPAGHPPAGTTQSQKSVCPACLVAPTLSHQHHHHPTSLCDFHRSQSVVERIDEEPELMDYELEQPSEKQQPKWAQSDDAPTVEHIEHHSYFSVTQTTAPAQPVPKDTYYDEPSGPIIESSSAALRRSSSPPTYSPHFSSPAPDSPRSERGRSPSLSSSPVEHFGSWTQRDIRIRSPVQATPSVASPYTDITRLRIDSQGRGSLYPGSVFTGSQRSGPNSYDVTVTIVNTDFASSVLCGYLRIANLTAEYPELTTYFHAEIIGSRYGFITADDWGATESGDMTHWGRFAAFRPLRGQLKRPGLTMRERERGTIFMRWKERFLVPDHKTKEINGASFAGFYYVAVSEATDESPATITAYYYHPQSEPYQQLSLSHVPSHTAGSFEFA